MRIQLEQLNFICKQLELGLGLAHLFTFVVVVFHFLFFPSLFSLLGSLLSPSTHFLSLLPSIITSFSTRGIIIELLNPSCKSLNETRNHHPPLFFFCHDPSPAQPRHHSSIHYLHFFIPHRQFYFSALIFFFHIRRSWPILLSSPLSSLSLSTTFVSPHNTSSP